MKIYVIETVVFYDDTYQSRYYSNLDSAVTQLTKMFNAEMKYLHDDYEDEIDENEVFQLKIDGINSEFRNDYEVTCIREIEVLDE